MRFRVTSEQVYKTVELLGFPVQYTPQSTLGTTDYAIRLYEVPLWCGIVAESLAAGVISNCRDLADILRELRCMEGVPDAIEVLFASSEDDRYSERMAIIRDFLRSKVELHHAR